MPQMANITVKKADGATDVTYTALSSSAGDQSPARWSDLSSATVAARRATYNSTSRFNGKRDARVVENVLKYPDVQTINGASVVLGNVVINISGTIPLQVTDTAIAEAVAQAANLFKASLVQDTFKTGYAAQ